MEIEVISIPLDDGKNWDRYAEGHEHATVYHLSGWSRIIEKTYGHKAYLLTAINKTAMAASQKISAEEILGILPIIKLRGIMGAPSLISMPFCDLGGAVADSMDIQRRLVLKAVLLAEQVSAKSIELRNTDKLTGNKDLKIAEYKKDLFYSEGKRKVRMLLKLPETTTKLMGSFKSKLRSQIRRPLKAGLTVEVGKSELIEDFYTVFLSNMRDLGSPVHSKKLFTNIFDELHDKTNIFVVKNNEKPLAVSMTIGFRGTLYNPWASSLRQYSKYSPNMLLYWKMLEFACDTGFNYFDFGRSSLDEGTYKFKKQWGASPVPLPWQFISYKNNRVGDSISESNAFRTAGEIWKRFPISLTKLIGPHLRKHIGL